MSKSYSCDLRERVVEAVESGASRHEAADRFEISVSSAVRWVQRWKETGSCAPKLAWRECFAVGGACATDLVLGDGTIGPDVG